MTATTFTKQSALSCILDRLDSVVLAIDNNDPEGLSDNLNEARHLISKAADLITDTINAETNN